MMDIAKQLVACKQWRWMPGMRARQVVIKYLDATWREHNGSSHGEAIARALLHVWGT